MNGISAGGEAAADPEKEKDKPVVLDADNSEAAIRLRRNQSRLNVAGFGVIIFAVWAIIRSIAYMVLNPYVLDNALADYSYDALYKVVVLIISGVLLAATTFIYIHVGFSARREAQGKKVKGIGYLIWDAVLMVFSAYSIISVFQANSFYTSYIDVAAAIFIEITSLLTMLELMIAAIKVKHMRKKAK